jgi:hypothetical protein
MENLTANRIWQTEVAPPILFLGGGSGNPNERGEMSSKRRTVTTIETHQVWVIRRLGSSNRPRCSECGEQAGMLTPEEAARLTGASTRDIYRRIEAGDTHFTEIPNVGLFVCLASVSDAEAG